MKVDPPQARVFVRKSEGWRDLGQADQITGIDLELADSERGRFELRFVANLWFGNSVESEILYPSIDELKRYRVFPFERTYRLELSAFQRLQTRLGPGQALIVFLLFTAGIALGLRHVLKLLRAASEPPGTTYGDYRLLEKIGQGGMGVVYSALSNDGLKVAIKSILPVLAQEEDFRKRFEREVNVCTRLSHPHLLAYEGFGVDSEGGLFSVTELLEGQTLKELLSSGQTNPPELALRVVEQIGWALGYLHEQPLLHRDVKPDNIFVCRNGTLKLMDMGLLRGDDLTVLTQTGHVLGTPAYFAPEQALDRAEEASDQYSLGIVLYEILTGLRPFRQTQAEMLAFQHATTAPEPPSTLEPRIPEGLETALLRMLAKKPADRFPSVMEAREELAAHLRHLDWTRDEELETVDTPLTPRPPGSPEQDS